MSRKRLLATYGTIMLLVSLPFTLLHLRAHTDDAYITWPQRIVASAANLCGPWGVAIVRLVDFPNAGMREFSWLWGIGLTLLVAVLIAVPLSIRWPVVQYVCIVLWTALMLVWFVTGFAQICSGLL